MRLTASSCFAFMTDDHQIKKLCLLVRKSTGIAAAAITLIPPQTTKQKATMYQLTQS